MVIERYFSMEGMEESPLYSGVLQCQSSLKAGRSLKEGLLLLVSGTRPLKTGLNTSFISDRHFKMSPGSIS